MTFVTPPWFTRTKIAFDEQNYITEIYKLPYLCFSPTYVKLDYIAQLLAQTGCLGKFAFGRYRTPKLARSRFFCVFFTFSCIIPKLFELEPCGFYQNFKLVKAHLFHCLEFFCDFFRLNYFEKTARISKFAYNFFLFSKKLEKY